MQRDWQPCSHCRKTKICARVAKEGRGARQGSRNGLSKREGENSSIRMVRADGELRKCRLEEESLMTSLSEYKVRVRTCEKRLEEEDLKAMAVM